MYLRTCCIKNIIFSMQLLAVCIFQSKCMDNKTAGVEIDVTIDSLWTAQQRSRNHRVFNSQLRSNLRYSFVEIRKYLDNCKKETLKKLCCDKPLDVKCNPKFEQWYSYYLDVADTKIFKRNHKNKAFLLWCSVIRKRHKQIL